jgi:ABC-type Fe3+/spermidine/putrescine transport system ATPase subunit
MALMHALRAEALRMQYDTVAVLHDITFTIRPGEHTAVLGQSGSGKSTLLRLLAGLEAPTGGEMWLNGQLGSRAGTVLIPPHERGMGMVFQDLALWPNLTALGNVELGLAARALAREARRARALEALKICGLEGLEQRRPAMLSIGQQQRVAFARALAARPAWLLLDEPFASLDLVLKERLIGELGHLVSTFDCTLLLVTHEPHDAQRLCPQLLVLEDGRVLETGSWESVMARPRSALLKLYGARTVQP